MAHVEIFSRRELSNCPRWSYAFATERKDHRYYEILEDTTHPEFNYGYFGVKDTDDNICAVQPFFVLAQDLLLAVGSRFDNLVGQVRRMFPRFMRVTTLMVGCVAGEGHLDATDEISRCALARALATDIIKHARALNDPCEYRLREL